VPSNSEDIDRGPGMELNVLVRGQSNAILMMEAGNWA
jgi:hypothetical protein